MKPGLFKKKDNKNQEKINYNILFAINFTTYRSYDRINFIFFKFGKQSYLSRTYWRETWERGACVTPVTQIGTEEHHSWSRDIRNFL